MVDRIPYTRRCTEGLAHNFTSVPSLLTAVNDTLVFLAISYRMMRFSLTGSSWKARAKSLLWGEGLNHFSRALLRSGQAYYL